MLPCGVVKLNSMYSSFVTFLNKGIIKWRLKQHVGKDEGVGVTITIHYNTINTDVFGSTAIIVASERTTTKIWITIGTKICLHILTTKPSFPIRGSLQDISGTDKGGGQVR